MIIVDKDNYEAEVLQSATPALWTSGARSAALAWPLCPKW